VIASWAWAPAAVVALYAFAVLALVVAGRREDATAVARFVPDCAVLFARLGRDPRLSRGDRWLALALVGYLALPVDLVPDVLPVAGQLDDAILAGLALRHIVRRVGADVVRQRWPGPERSLLVLLRAAGTP
jgi:uncharacterized membrane protein YkvA (DUF1232 family)